jgi:hypothetical protein
VDGPDWELTAEHDGYQRRFGALHRRTLKREATSIAIYDCLVGAAQDAEIVFQLAPGLETRRNGQHIAVSANGVALVEISLPDDGYEIRSGGDNPGEGGWVSERFGQKVPAPRVEWRGKVDASGIVSRISVLAR